MGHKTDQRRYAAPDASRLTPDACDSLTPLELTALAKSVKETALKDARPKLADGNHEVDFTVRLHGPMLVAPTQPSKEREKLSTDSLLGLLLSHLSRRTVNDLLAKVEVDLAAWREWQTDTVDVPNSLMPEADRLVALACRERESTKRGNITAPLTIELVSRG